MQGSPCARVFCTSPCQVLLPHEDLPPWQEAGPKGELGTLLYLFLLLQNCGFYF